MNKTQVKVKNDGHYNTWDESKKVCLLHRGDVLEVVREIQDCEPDRTDRRWLHHGWCCRRFDGALVFVEHENGKEII